MELATGRGKYATVREKPRAPVCGTGIGAGQAPVGRWQFRGSQCDEGQPHSTRAVGKWRRSYHTVRQYLAPTMARRKDAAMRYVAILMFMLASSVLRKVRYSSGGKMEGESARIAEPHNSSARQEDYTPETCGTGRRALVPTSMPPMRAVMILSTLAQTPGSKRGTLRYRI